MLQSVALYMCLCIGLTMEAPICRPTIKEGQIGTPEIGGFISLECEIATCNKPAKIVFEKAGLNETWMPVFEGISTTQYKALDTVTEYTLENRNYYYAFRTSVHSLHIVPLILKDHGKWRCVLYDVTGKGYDSRPLNVTVYVSPDVDNFYISPNKSHLLFHQTQEFTCVADGIHPKPNVLWKMNGVEHKGIADSQQRTNQLWVVTNTIRLSFDTIGVNKLSCVLNANARVTWMECNIDITVQAPICTPTLTEGQVKKLEIGGFISLECDISTCNNRTKIVFEKADINETWTPIFEGVHKAYQNAVDTASEHYTQGRHYYNPLRTSVKSLHIIPLLLRDYGKWRCVVDDVTGKEYTSRPLYVNVYAQPAVGDFYINPNSSHLVIDQTQEFTCMADGIHPEPEVVWHLNGVIHQGNATYQQRDDRILVVMNTIRLQLDTLGVNKLNCVVKTKKKDPWLENHINITVQEPAMVLHPRLDTTEAVDAYSIFTLRCSGSGYIPRIIWYCNGKRILRNNIRYIIKEEYDRSRCEGSITSKPMDPAFACRNTEHYTDIFECVIKLEPPFNSSAESAKMNVTFTKDQCKQAHVGTLVATPILATVIVALVVACIVVLVYLKRKKDTDFAFYNSMTLQETLELIYTPEARLIMCSRKRVDDQIVLFEYGTHRVFIHGVNNLTQHTEYTCDVKIHDMIRISNDSFVATSTGTYCTHFLRVVNLNVRSLDNIPRETEIMKVLICAETKNSFITCGISRYSPHDDGHTDGEMGDREDLASGYERYKISISRVGINMMKPKFTPIHIRTVPMTKEPIYIAVTPDKRRIIMVTSNGELYVVPLEKTNTDLIKLKCKKDADRSVRSLFINNHDLILGDFVGKILVYTRDLHNLVVQNLEKPINGITVHGRRMIVCCGHEGQQQSIKVFSPKHRVEGTSLTEMSRMDHITKSHVDHM